MKRAVWMWGIGAVIGVPLVAYGVATALARPVAPHAVFERLPATQQVIAHRGGAGIWPENTLFAFQKAAALGVDMLEMDVHASADGTLVVMHDGTVDRTTDGSGALKAMPLQAIQALDAGYRWTDDNGQSYPFRDQGICVPTLEEVFAALPDMPMTIEIKQEQPSIGAKLCDLIRRYNKTHQVVVGSFHVAALNEFRRLCPEVATSAQSDEVRTFVALNIAYLTKVWSPHTVMFQVPVSFGERRIVTPGFVRHAHERGLKVQVWTVNEIAEMEDLLVMGVDGLISDHPDRLMAFLGR